jgi:hypothetical protein
MRTARDSASEKAAQLLSVNAIRAGISAYERGLARGRPPRNPQAVREGQHRQGEMVLCKDVELRPREDEQPVWVRIIKLPKPILVGPPDNRQQLKAGDYYICLLEEVKT